MMLDALRFLSDENNKIARAQLAIAIKTKFYKKDWIGIPSYSSLPRIIFPQRFLKG